MTSLSPYRVLHYNLLLSVRLTVSADNLKDMRHGTISELRRPLLRCVSQSRLSRARVSFLLLFSITSMI
jgi:hypothetical protein